MAKTLTSEREIREWAEARGGNPLLMDVPTGTGDTRQLLQLTFGQDLLNSSENEGPDRVGGWELASWDDWFKALETQKLALLVSDDPAGGNEHEFQFIPRD